MERIFVKDLDMASFIVARGAVKIMIHQTDRITVWWTTSNRFWYIDMPWSEEREQAIRRGENPVDRWEYTPGKLVDFENAIEESISDATIMEDAQAFYAAGWRARDVEDLKEYLALSENTALRIADALGRI